MSREDLIMSSTETVQNLVKKYNDHAVDEDLVSVGMVAVVECVDRCLEEKMTDENQILARCNVWARNAILSEVYKAKIKFSNDEKDYENAELPEDITLIVHDVRNTLSARDRDVFDLLYAGFKKEEIMEKLHIEKSTFYNIIGRIKKIILEK